MAELPLRPFGLAADLSADEDWAFNLLFWLKFSARVCSHLSKAAFRYINLRA